MAVRVLTWNLWWRFGPWEQRQPAIARVLRDEVPDIVCLQEVFGEQGGLDQAQRLGDELGLHVARTEGPWFEGVSFGNAVLSRWPVLRHEERALPRHDGAPGHRRALVAVLDTPHGEWPVISTHFDHRFDASAARQRQSRALLELVAEVRGDASTAPPVIVGADLNAVPDADEVRMLTGRTAAPVPDLVLSDAWEHAGLGEGHTWRGTNPYSADSAWPNRRIDYVLVSWPRPKPFGNPVRAWLAALDPVDGVHASDHAALVVDLADTTPRPARAGR